MKNILLIGGSGTWSGKAYIPSIKNSSNEVSLSVILDPVNPYYSDKTISHFDYLSANNVKWIKAKRNCDEELVKTIISENDIDIVIISTPPKFHYEYTLACLKSGVDVICDKPIVATPTQSSSTLCAYANIEKHNKLLQAINESYNKKALRRCYVLTPLRRKLQETYTNIYDTCKLIKTSFGQDVTNVLVSHNDGVFRFDDEIELKCGSHGYSDGFGKLTHTGYHILDVASGILQYGCNLEDVECVCKIINCTTVKDMLNSNSNKILANLIHSDFQSSKLSENALNSEMDITISYTLLRHNVKFCNIVIDLIHCGRSNRTLDHYDFVNYNDQGRTNELTMHIQQGSLFSSQFILSTESGSGGTVGNGYTFKNFHPVVAKKIHEEPNQVLDFKNQSPETTKDIISKFFNILCKENLDGYYLYAEFLKQAITDEMYIAALISKSTGKEYRWHLGNI